MNNKMVKLASHDFLELSDARGSTLHVSRGSVWVTQQGDRSDVVLNAGDTWTIEQLGLTVVEAREDVEVNVIGSRPQHRRVRSGRDPWQTRLARWFERAAERHLRRRWVPHV